MTSIEWLEEQLNPDMKTMQGNIIQGLLEQAKEMHKTETERMYSKEDLKTAWEESESNFCGLEFGKNRFEVWFEQFKKD